MQSWKVECLDLMELQIKLPLMEVQPKKGAGTRS